ncbi:hypothetical protein Baya_16393 [Bagarius yarrelli]|uniref:Uncharacterized protein n=1 Tax=Bagarius yarrelli TaxID=175774 RepID=A0A556VVF7_BAGYA|nr:hypothetical protein Baya_16393 [Bagarius yarrelli]
MLRIAGEREVTGWSWKPPSAPSGTFAWLLVQRCFYYYLQLLRQWRAELKGASAVNLRSSAEKRKCSFSYQPFEQLRKLIGVRVKSAAEVQRRAEGQESVPAGDEVMVRNTRAAETHHNHKPQTSQNTFKPHTAPGPRSSGGHRYG